MKIDSIQKKDNMYQFYLENTYIATAAEVEKMTFPQKPMRAKNTISPMYYVSYYYWTWQDLADMGLTAEKLSATQIPQECLSDDHVMVILSALTSDLLEECGKNCKQFEREYRPKRFPLGHVL